MRMRNILFVLTLLIVTGFLAGCVQPQVTNTTGPSQAPSATPTTPGSPVVTVTIATPEKIITSGELIAFVKRAADYARENGNEKALSAFNDPNGPFVIGNVYIFATGYDGTVLAEPFNPGAVGTNILDRTDSFGAPYVRNMGETARFGRGLVELFVPDPRVRLLGRADACGCGGRGRDLLCRSRDCTRPKERSTLRRS